MTSQKKQDEAKVLVVDDHPIVREGLVTLINSAPDLVVCGEAGNGGEALEMAKSLSPDAAVIDISMVGMSGLDLVKELRARKNDTPVVMLSVHDEKVYAERALRAGAQGYVMKKEARDSIVKAIREVLAGRIFVQDHVATRLISMLASDSTRQAGDDPLARLTNRELQILQYMAADLATRDIAEELNLSISTVQSHQANIKQKLEIRTVNELAAFARSQV